MSLYLDRKFLLLTSARLEQFKEKAPDLYNFRCPFCGDSRKNKLKARGYIFKAQDYNGYGYKCWNCNISTNFSNFIKHLDPLVYKDYALEKFEADGGWHKVGQVPVNEPVGLPMEEPGGIALDENDPVGLHQIELMRINQLPADHFARVYIEARKIPADRMDEIFFAPDFKLFLDENFPWHGKDKLKENDPRIIVFHTDRAGYITNVSGRSFTADPKQRYMKVKVVEYKKIFGVNRLDLSKKIYLVEGEFDSMFLPNAVASGDANLNNTADWLLNMFDVEPVLVFDKEPRNKQLVGIIQDAIDNGWNVCMLPETFPGKDINEAVVAGLTPDQVQKIIDENTFSELLAQLRLTSWKR
jgi:hypothetical protein